ncbi:hypothetical protein [Rhizobium sp. BR 314]|uniref:hypothetical protein n=1 Tax=Rhizobium sp. BR 314 TaxID=3040013 RepID=UPI0039BF0E18
MKVARFISAALGFCVSSCSIMGSDPAMLNGVGTDLYTSTLPQRAINIESYAGNICYAASLSYQLQSRQPVCDYSKFGSGDWNVFVQMGMYDIDQRCDSYLEWLDVVKRTRAPITNQINATGRLTGQIIGLSGAAVSAMTIVSAAFGYAADTFSNIQSSLLLELDHSTVQSVVYGVQRRLRTEIASNPVASKPQALTQLRTYLRSCMPFTIATEANTQLSALGLGASPTSVSLLSVPAGSRPPLTSHSRPGRTPLTPGLEGYTAVLAPDLVSKKGVTVEKLRLALSHLCVDTGATTVSNARTKASIGWFQQLHDGPAGRTGQLNSADITRLAEERTTCDGEISKNWFEKERFPTGIGDAQDLLDALNKKTSSTLTAKSSQGDIRAAIAKYRNDYHHGGGDELDPDTTNKLLNPTEVQNM